MTPVEKRDAFRALHVPDDPLLMPNPWDIGSAKVLAGLGARALATTSAGHAFTIGKPDMGRVTPDEAFGHAADIVGATDLPVNADLENGYGADPETAAATVRWAAEVGLAGCSIEDTDMESEGPGAYAFDLTVERAKACIAAARETGIVLTLRADGFMNRAYDADEAVRRCEAFAELGADVIYAPLVKPETVKRLAMLGPPVNVIGVHKMAALSVAEIGALGAARISIGSGLARVTHQALLDAGRAMMTGDLTPLQGAASGDEVDGYLV